MAQPRPRALHMVQYGDLYGGRDLTLYDILICNASLPESGARSSAPDAVWFGSFNAQAVGLWGADNPFWNSLRAAMLDYILLDPETGEPVFSADHKMVYFDYRKIEGAKVYAKWINENCPFEVYIDEFTAELEPWKLPDFPQSILPELQAAYILWREAVLAALRVERPDRPIIANTAGLIDPRLNGITIEQAHIENLGNVMALARFVVQFNRGRQPCYSVDWSGAWDFDEIGIHAGELT